MNDAKSVSEQVKALVRTVVPPPIRAAVRWGANAPMQSKSAVERALIKHRIDSAARSGETVRLEGFTVKVNRGANPFHLYEDIFLKRVYHFEAQTPSPRILDCGANMGMSMLYFKHVYPGASIVAFEPDPSIFGYLQENIRLNNLANVQAVQAALSSKEGTLTFHSDGEVASHLATYQPEGATQGFTTVQVRCIRLHDYLAEPVDFMKMNIEGAEWEVLADIEPLITRIREMNIEYHRLPGVPCSLHSILDLLHRNGFQYVVSDFGMFMYGSPQPPARVDPAATFWRQIYARRKD